MALYLTNFKRINTSFGEKNTIQQSIDIVFEFEEDITDENIDLLHEKAFEELFEQFPSWKSYDPPKHCQNGWSTILGPYEFKRL